MFSVTLETAGNLPLQNAPSRSLRGDQSPASDGFSALIDSNAVDPAGTDRPDTPDRPSPPRPDQPSAASDNRQARDKASSSSAPRTSSPQAADRAPAQPVAADGSIKTGTTSKPGSGFAKSETVKAAIKDAASDVVASLDAAGPSDPATSPQAPASTAAMPAPVAVAIAIAVPLPATGGVVAPEADASAPQPLAIAAAAIAASSSTVAASKPAAAAPAQAATDPAPDAPASGFAAGTSPGVAQTPSAAPVSGRETIAVAQAAASDSVAAPVSQPATKPDATAPAEPQLAAVVATAAVAPKPAPKAPAAVLPGENTSPVKTGIAPGATDPSAAPASPERTERSIAPQGPATDGKQTGGIAVGAANIHPASTEAPTAAATTLLHDHRAAAAPVQSEPSDTGQVASLVQQPQAQAGAIVPAAAQLSVTATASAAVPLNGLALQIAVSAQSGKSRFEIRLDPAELGRIDVRIDVDRHGQLTSHLTVEKPETLAMLRQDAPQLQRALDNAGFRTGDSGLQFSLRDHSGSGQNGGNETGRNAHRLIISEEDGVPAAFAGRTYGRLSGSGSGVDISV